MTVNSLGITTAGKILFDTLQYYAPSNAEWEDLPMYASKAAFANYNLCSQGSNASWEQAAVDQAFTAIGYPRLSTEIPCSF